LHADSTNAVSVVIGPVGTSAATTNQRLAPNQTEYKAIPQNAGYGVYSIQNT